MQFFFISLIVNKTSQKYIPKVLKRNSFSFRRVKRVDVKRVFLETRFCQFAYIITRKIIDCNYAEYELTIEIIALFKVLFLIAKSCK